MPSEHTPYTVDDIQAPEAGTEFSLPDGRIWVVGNEPRFFLSNDDDGQWYLIPVEHFDEWQDWCNLSIRDWAEDDDRPDWDVPEYAKLIDGLHVLSFTNPKEDL